MKTCQELTAGLRGHYSGWITIVDQEWLCQFLQEQYSLKPPPTILEVGAFAGGTTNLMVLASGGRAIVVDNWSAGPDLRNDFIRETTESGFYPEKIEVVDGDSRDVGRSWPSRDEPHVNLVYLDADHSYEACRDDLLLFAPWARDFLLIDDYDLDAVRQATDEYISSGPWSVIRKPNLEKIETPEKLFAAKRIR